MLAIRRPFERFGRLGNQALPIHAGSHGFDVAVSVLFLQVYLQTLSAIAPFAPTEALNHRLIQLHLCLLTGAVVVLAFASGIRGTSRNTQDLSQNFMAVRYCMNRKRSTFVSRRSRPPLF